MINSNADIKDITDKNEPDKGCGFQNIIESNCKLSKKSRKVCNDYDGFVGSVDSIILAKDRLGHQSYVQGRKFPTSISDHTFATDNENNKDTRSANKCRTL